MFSDLFKQGAPQLDEPRSVIIVSQANSVAVGHAVVAGRVRRNVGLAQENLPPQSQLVSDRHQQVELVTLYCPVLART